MQWVENKREIDSMIPSFIGALNSASEKANPSGQVLVIELTEFEELGNKLLAAYEDIANRALPLTLNQEIESVLGERSLIWPSVLDGMTKHKLVSLK